MNIELAVKQAHELIDKTVVNANLLSKELTETEMSKDTVVTFSILIDSHLFMLNIIEKGMMKMESLNVPKEELQKLIEKYEVSMESTEKLTAIFKKKLEDDIVKMRSQGVTSPTVH